MSDGLLSAAKGEVGGGLMSCETAMTPGIDVVVVWDFDNTMVDANTDTFVFECLAPEILEKEIYLSELQWTARMNHALSLLPAAGVSPKQVLECAARAPLPDDTASALRLIRDCPRAVSAVISDANTLYIDAVLREHKLGDAFEAGILSNPASIVSVEASTVAEESPSSPRVLSRLAVSPFCPALHENHGCRACSANMCKGELVRELQARPAYASATFVYVGDGSNDFCGCRQLPSGGRVLARTGFALAKKLESSAVAASVTLWASPLELLQALKSILAS